MANPATDTTYSGMIVARYDAVRRIVRISGTGSWSMALMERHFDELQRLLVRPRSGGGSVRVLSDLSQAAVQRPDVAARIERFTMDTYGPDDRVAIVVASSLLRMQMRRVVLRARFETFLSAGAAETWLTAYDDAPNPSVEVLRAPRRATSIVTTVESLGGEILAARIINISSSGFLLDGRGRLTTGERLRVPLPGFGVVAGTIVRVRENLAGVRFDQPIEIGRLRLI